MGVSTPGLMQRPAFLVAAGSGAHYPFWGWEGDKFRPTSNFRVLKVPVAWFCSGSGLG